MAARKRWNTKKETTLKSVEISYRSAAQKKFGGLIFVGSIIYINTLNLTDMLGLFLPGVFLLNIDYNLANIDSVMTSSG